MIPPDVVHVILSGPRRTASDLAVMADFATRLRSLGHLVTTPLEIARKASATFRSQTYLRTAVETAMEADALGLLPGWEECDLSVTARDVVESLAVPIYVYDPETDAFAPAEDVA